MRKVLWADDEADGNLDIIARAIRSSGEVELRIALTLEDALDLVSGQQQERWDRVITDIILPHDDYLGARQDVGIEIARAAAEEKIADIIFLTVHRRNSLMEEIRSIQERYGIDEIAFYNKLALSGSSFRQFLERVRS